ncbi:rhomboid family intramembrane serine protease [Dyadobacter sandarakinus]|uniref:Rhomboid family intramembrane serine protease n=1 Tax=Dyadobacter sandarakinus TaxID=2747268 RepID=A0ABX7IAT1_9BACT|nr:rhomboid family intramembrane serine protease [Dyadobacter sandarakinus]QRR02918.1 rhomboid family intramembrane serine protease [Dyadobacter sandarakinus]
MLSITPTVRNLLILNVLFFIVDSYVIDLTGGFALRSFLSPAFMPYQFVTYMFLHGSLGHLFSNMFGLFMFGPLLERMWGPKRFLFFYFFTGIGAGLLFSGIDYFENSRVREAVEIYTQSPSPDALVDFTSKYGRAFHESDFMREFSNQFEENPANSQYIQQSINIVTTYYQSLINTPMVGASGAIFGILMAFGLLFPNTELFLLFVPFPVKAKYFVAFYGLYELYSGIQNAQSDNVAHFAHIGGMLFAYILLRYWNMRKTNFY